MNDAEKYLDRPLSRRRTREAAERVAMISIEADTRREYTYGRLYRDSLAVAGWLAAQGVEKGDRVAILLENRPEWPMGYFGAPVGGGGGRAPGSGLPLGPYPLRPGADPGQGSSSPFPRPPSPSCRSSPFWKRLWWWGKPGNPTAKSSISPRSCNHPGSETGLPVIGPGDLASIIYTSGTTGMPKGVMLTHKNFCANYRGVAQLNAIRPDDNLLAILPLHHAFPFTATLLLPLFSRVKITYLDTLKAEAILRCVKEQRVTILVLTPQVLQHFYQGMQRQLELHSLAAAAPAAGLSQFFPAPVSKPGD